MTKEEVRAVSIAKLDLTPGAVLYDVGAGTGSISIEASRQLAGGTVYAIERDPEALSLLRLLPPFFCGLVLGLLGKSKGLVAGTLVLFLAPLLLLAGSWTAQGWWEEVLLEPFPAWAAMLLSWGKTALYLLAPAAGYWMTGLYLSHRAKKK